MMPYDPELDDFLKSKEDKKKISFTPDSPVGKTAQQPAAPVPDEAAEAKSMMADFDTHRADTQEKGRNSRLLGGLAEAFSTIGTRGQAPESDNQYYRGIANQDSKYNKELDEYIQNRLEGHKLEIQARKKAEPEKQNFSYIETPNGLVAANNANPGDIRNIGIEKYHAPEKPSYDYVTGDNGIVTAVNKSNPKDTYTVGGIGKTKEGDLPKDYQGKLTKLNASDKARFDNVRSASNALRKMRNALASGEDRYSMFGDNDYTMNLALFNEALGRMQSGGAISKPEESRFSAMARSALDDPDTQKAKLDNLVSEMDSRMNTLGFNPDEINDKDYQAARQLKPVSKAGATAGPAPTPGPGAPPVKTVTKKQYSQKLNKTKIIYSDGTEEVIDGK